MQLCPLRQVTLILVQCTRPGAASTQRCSLALCVSSEMPNDSVWELELPTSPHCASVDPAGAGLGSKACICRHTWSG